MATFGILLGDIKPAPSTVHVPGQTALTLLGRYR